MMNRLAHRKTGPLRLALTLAALCSATALAGCDTTGDDYSSGYSNSSYSDDYAARQQREDDEFSLQQQAEDQQLTNEEESNY